MKKYFFILLNLSFFLAHAQENDPKLQLYIDQGINFMEAGAYESAEEKFIAVIDNLKPLPSKLAYYYGKNSYFLGKYKSSINWLNKYIQLKGVDSQFYKDAKKYLVLAETAFLENNVEEINEINSSLENDFDCYSQDRIVCPACKGSGVLIKRGAMENIYQTCPFSGGDGFLTCEEYNLYMKGKLKPVANQ